VSQEAKSIISGLLVRNPEERLGSSNTLGFNAKEVQL
jgi:hypothetical protein